MEEHLIKDVILQTNRWLEDSQGKSEKKAVQKLLKILVFTHTQVKRLRQYRQKQTTSLEFQKFTVSMNNVVFYQTRKTRFKIGGFGKAKKVVRIPNMSK